MSADLSQAVLFPPPKLADLVLHYCDASFHVQNFVLHHHSCYFKTYFEMFLLQPPSSSSSSDASSMQLMAALRLPSRRSLAITRR